MIVQITNSRFFRDRILTYDSEGINQVYYKFIVLKYFFVTQNGYSGYIESPRLFINFLRSGNILHEYLSPGYSQIYFTLFKPEPYKEKVVEDDDGNEVTLKYYSEKYFYKVRFEKDSWVKLDFKGIVIKRQADNNDVDPIETKNIIICPTSINSITPIDINAPKRYFDENGIPLR